jgi:hypothetical protein
LAERSTLTKLFVHPGLALEACVARTGRESLGIVAKKV